MPEVVGRVSVCSTRIRVRKLNTGDEVKIYAGSKLIGGGTATWTDDVFDLQHGIKLNPGELITATRHDVKLNVTSDPSSNEVRVEPNQTGPIIFIGPIYECSQNIQTAGVIPGVNEKVKSLNTNGTFTSRGEYQSIYGEGIPIISPPIHQSDKLFIYQEGCGITGVTDIPFPKISNIPLPLPLPVIKEPAECDLVVTINNLIPGAHINVERYDSQGKLISKLSTYTAKETKTVRMGQLNLQDKLVVTEEFDPECHLDKLISNVTVEKKQELTQPALGDICEGPNPRANVTNLIIGSEVIFNVVDSITGNNREISCGQTDCTKNTFTLPKLNAGDKVTVKQGRCGKWSIISDPPVVVMAFERPQRDPYFSENLYNCAGIVHVKGVPHGSRIDVCSVQYAHSSIGHIDYAEQPEVDICLEKPFRAGESIFLKVTFCNGEFITTDPPVLVVNAELTAPTFGDMTLKNAGEVITIVPVEKIIPGAEVFVFVKNQPYPSGHKQCGTSKDFIIIEDKKDYLSRNDTVKVMQRLCADSNPTTITVVPAPPKIISVGASPTSGVISPPAHPSLAVGFNPNVQGIVDKKEWDYNGDGIPDPIQNPYYFDTEGTHTVKYTVSNDQGSDSKTVDIQVTKAVTPPPSNGTKEILISNCSGEDIVVWLMDVNASTPSYIKAKEIPAYTGGGGPCPPTSEVVPLTDKIQYNLIIVKPSLCPDPNSTSSSCSKLVDANFLGDSKGQSYPINVP